MRKGLNQIQVSLLDIVRIPNCHDVHRSQALLELPIRPWMEIRLLYARLLKDSSSQIVGAPWPPMPPELVVDNEGVERHEA
jgi:hypothetical protein